MTFINKITDYFIGTDAHKEYAGFRNHCKKNIAYFMNALEREEDESAKYACSESIKKFQKISIDLYIHEAREFICGRLIPNYILSSSFYELHNGNKLEFLLFLIFGEFSRFGLSEFFKKERGNMKEEFNKFQSALDERKLYLPEETKSEPYLEFKLDLDGCDYLTEDDFKKN